MLLLVLASVLAVARADCDACIEGRCYTRKTLARELHIPDQMAIDRKNGILYVHTDSEMNTAFFHEDLTIQLVRRQNFTGLAVDQDTQILYTADSKNIQQYSKDSLNTCNNKTVLPRKFGNEQPIMLIHKDCITYTKKSKTGLFFLNKDGTEEWIYGSSKKFTISDFVVQVGCIPTKLYFVANDTTYFLGHSEKTINGTTKFVPDDSLLVARKNFVLSTDKYNNVFFKDATLNVIYKMNDETNKLVEYAAYESGSVDKFVFDKNNNIVFYDSSDGSFNLWKPDLSDSARCTITAPHSKYQITKKPNIDQNCFNH
ncbi:uncharacterized protein [Choristoneura fumiferana]|uniref:uncharacterized protein n=1 Tax=Choristoneura fumiferana TaxID=7141 RepID=UPI003D1588A5